MKKPLDPNSHAVLDYALSAGCLTIPVVAGFNCASSFVSYGFGMAQMGLSLMTNYPMGAMKTIPFKVHGMIELGTAVGLMALPFVSKMLDMKSKTFFFSSGASLLAVYLLTDYSEQAVIEAQQDFDHMKQEAHDQIEHVVDGAPLPMPVKEAIRKVS